MFESIHHNYSFDGMTGATYSADEAFGYISFMSEHCRVGILSAIGPDDATRECALSHWKGFRELWRASAREVVTDYSQSPAGAVAAA